MRKKNYLTELNNIKSLVDKVKTLNESLSFADEYGNDGGYDESEYDESMTSPQYDEYDDEAEGDENDVIENIREVALKGMVKLCKTPDSPQYELLKKIFLLIDKSNEKRNEEENASK